MQKLTFDKTTHTYTLGAQVLPSVTQVLKATGILTVSPFSTGPELGSEIHSACHDLNLGKLNIDNYSHDVLPYLLGYEKFLAHTKFVPKLAEQRCYHRQYLYAGTIDVLGNIGNKQALVDIKTGVKNKASLVQLVAYRNMVVQRADEKIMCFTLYLNKKGGYTVDMVQPSEVIYLWNVFLAALTVYNYSH